MNIRKEQGKQVYSYLFNMDKAEEIEFKEMAEKAGLSLADLIRTALNEYKTKRS